MKHLTRITALSLVTFCLLILNGCSQKSTTESSKSSNEPSADVNTINSAPQKPKSKRPAPDFTVTAIELFKELKADRTKTQKKYADKQIAVSGRVTITGVTRTPISVQLDAGAVLDFVVGEFDEEEKEKVVTLKEGQNVIMQCLSGSDYWAMFPRLKHCTIVNVE